MGIIKNNPTFSELSRLFDHGLMLTIDKTSQLLNRACSKVEEKLSKCEERITQYVDGITKKTSADLDLAEAIVNKELCNKVMMMNH